jgi:hypothetical protein
MKWPAQGPARSIRIKGSFLLLAGFRAAPRLRFASAPMNMSGYSMENQDQISPEKLPVPQKMSGIGNVQMKITATPEAQTRLNQGLYLLHDFWDTQTRNALASDFPSYTRDLSNVEANWCL